MNKKDNDVGNRIKYAREYRNLTLKELSNKCSELDFGITYNAMWQWETGRRVPKYEAIRTIAKVLAIQTQYFLPGEHFDDPIERIQPYLMLDESVERQETDIIPAKAFNSKGLKIGYINTRLERLTSNDLDSVINAINKMLKKRS